jgi:hypothetical protein
MQHRHDRGLCKFVCTATLELDLSEISTHQQYIVDVDGFARHAAALHALAVLALQHPGGLASQGRPDPSSPQFIIGEDLRWQSGEALAND